MARQPFNRLLGCLFDTAGVVALPMRSCPHQPRFPGIAVAECLPMLPYEGEGVAIIAVGQCPLLLLGHTRRAMLSLHRLSVRCTPIPMFIHVRHGMPVRTIPPIWPIPVLLCFAK